MISNVNHFTFIKFQDQLFGMTIKLYILNVMRVSLICETLNAFGLKILLVNTKGLIYFNVNVMRMKCHKCTCVPK